MSTIGTPTPTTTAADPAKPVTAVPFNFTKYTAWFGGAASAIAAALVAVLPQFKDVPIPVEVAIIGVIGAGFIAVAIAAGADVLGRSYVTANPPPAAPATSPAATTPAAMLALPTPLAVTISGAGSAIAVAARYKTDGTLEYLVGPPSGRLDWETGEAVSLAAPPTPTPSSATPPVIVALPETLPVTVGGGSPANAVAALYKADGTLEYLVGPPGKKLKWKPQDAVKLAAPPPTAGGKKRTAAATNGRT